MKARITFLIGTVMMVAVAMSMGADEQNNASLKLFPVYQNGKAGFIDKSGRVVIAPQFVEANPFSDGLARVELGEQSESNNPATRLRTLVTKGLGRRYAFIDVTGRIVIPSQPFFAVYDFSEGLALVTVSDASNERRDGYINKEGRLVIEPQFTHGSKFSEGLAGVEKDGRFGYIDRKGELLIPLKFGRAGLFAGGLAAVEYEGRQGYIDKTGKFVIKPLFDEACNFSEGLACVKVGQKYGYIDRTGKMIIEPRFDVAHDFSDGLARVRVGDKIDYIDAAGRIAFPCQWNLAEDFSEGLARVSVNNKIGFIDRQGRIVIAPQFSSADDFKNGLAPVETFTRPQGLERGYIDKTGRYVWRSRG
jgi:hypothetical protein